MNRLQVAVGRRSNWHHDEHSIKAIINDRCLNVSIDGKAIYGGYANNRRSDSKLLRQKRNSRLLRSVCNENSNDGSRSIVQIGQDIFMPKKAKQINGMSTSSREI